MPLRLRTLLLSLIFYLALALVRPESIAQTDGFVRFGKLGSNADMIGAGVSDRSVPTPAGWIPIELSAQSITALSSWTNGIGAVVGKPNPGEFIVRKRVDFTSPELLHAILMGTNIASVELVFRTRGTIQGPFYSVMLKDAYIRRVAHRGDSRKGGPNTAAEEIALAYHSIEWLYRAVNETGDFFLSTTLNWNVVAGTTAEALLPNMDRLPPFTASDELTRLPGFGFSVPVLDLLANDGPDAGFAGVLPESALGRRISIAGGIVTYSPPLVDTGSEDNFSYHVQNQAGALNRGSVIVKVRRPPSPDLRLARSAEQTVEVSLSGEAGLRYQLQSSEVLGSDWTNRETPRSPAGDGLVRWTHPVGIASVFFRALVVP
ncbi:MAG TPA: type VI secretion system tube protein Hcp [Verrucomicrobiae bacterium]